MNNGNNKLPVTCPHCGQRFSVSSPKIEILNTPRVSILVTTHEKLIQCICGGRSVIGIEAYKLGWNIVGLSEEQASQLEDKKIIVPTVAPLGRIN